MNRVLAIAAFLASCGWDGAEQTPVAADFSPRRFARLWRLDGSQAILMDADADQKTPSFVAIAKLLRDAGLSAPAIIAADPPQGLVLMEDFGSRNIGRLLDDGAAARPYFERAAAVLAHLHDAVTVPELAALNLPLFDGDLLVEQAGLFLDFYAPAVDRAAFNAALHAALASARTLPQSLLLRDFMPDNLMDLPERPGVQNIGLLDFQDAGIGPIAYDLASLCEVVRRDGGVELLDRVIASYCERRLGKIDPAALRPACRALAAQRHLRILGILAKRSQQGRRDKDAYIPRMRAYVQHLLQDDALRPLRDVIASRL